VAGILIGDGAVLTLDGWIEPGYVFIAGETIREIHSGTPSPNLAQQADTLISARHAAVLPGLTNAHTHLSQTLMRGLAAGKPLLRWLKELIWPLQSAMTADDVRLAALLGLAENLRCGATQVVEHHKITATAAHTDAVCEAAQIAGARLTLARAWADRGANAEPPQSILADLERLFEQWQQPAAGLPQIGIANGPLVPWRCSAETLRDTRALARRWGAATHIHVSETREEVQLSIDETGLPPIRWLDSIGVLGPDVQIVHAVWPGEGEIDLLAERAAPVVHCPVSNAVLASGIAPVGAMRRQGIDLRLGTDGPASNDNQDLFGTLKSALGLARLAAADPTALSPSEALAMALAGRTLSPGAPADVIVVDLNTSRAAPVHDLDSALALCASGSDVTTAIVGGRLVVRDGRLQTLDEDALLDECRAAANSLRRRAGLA
jgi:5-methylthioadenosine/S-adenosylhomocysteine deaminase